MAMFIDARRMLIGYLAFSQGRNDHWLSGNGADAVSVASGIKSACIFIQECAQRVVSRFGLAVRR